MGMDELRHAAGQPRSGPPSADRSREGRELSDLGLIGRTIGDFHLLEVLGRGGMGTVYRAEGIKRNVGQRVAVKVIAPHIADHPQSAGGSRPRPTRSAASTTPT